MGVKIMDKEAQEKIKNYAAKWFDRGRECGKALITKDMLKELEEEGEKLLSELGYRKLPKDKPPLLSDGGIENILNNLASRSKDKDGNYIPKCEIRDSLYGDYPIATPFVSAKYIAQAQRGMDIKHYEEVSDNIC